MYLVNNNLVEAEALLRGDARNTVSFLASKNVKSSLGTTRISQEDVAAMETELDAYYMPFYFHDLRTNEIIAFHAFLENVSDSFDVDYNESEGYGRIGKVYTYKNTLVQRRPCE